MKVSVYFFGLKEIIITKLLYVKPDIARAQPTIRTIPDICDTF